MIIPNQQQFTVEYASQNFNKVIKSAEKEAILLTQNEQKFLLINQDVLETFIVLQDQEILNDIEIAREEYQKGTTLTMKDIFN